MNGERELKMQNDALKSQYLKDFNEGFRHILSEDYQVEVTNVRETKEGNEFEIYLSRHIRDVEHSLDEYDNLFLKAKEGFKRDRGAGSYADQRAYKKEHNSASSKVVVNLWRPCSRNLRYIKGIHQQIFLKYTNLKDVEKVLTDSVISY